jgi:cyanate permease
MQFRQKERATIPVRVFKQRTILLSCVFSALLSGALYTHLFYLPFYFQASKGTNAEVSGIRIIAYLISMKVASIAIGGLVTEIEYCTPFTWFSSLSSHLAADSYTLSKSTPHLAFKLATKFLLISAWDLACKYLSLLYKS